MIKRVLLAIFLTVLYLVVFAAGSFLRPFHVTQALSAHGLAVRLFVWDGVLVMLGTYALTLVIAAIGRRIREIAPLATGCLLVAGLLGYLARLGFVTREF